MKQVVQSTGTAARLDGAPSLRIALVFRAPLGGLFRHVLDLANGLADRGHSVGIICDDRACNTLSEQMLAGIAPRLKLGLVRIPIDREPALADLNVAMRVRKILRNWEPDIVHGHGAKGGLYARLTPRRMAGKRIVRAYTPHGGSLNYAPGTLVHRFFMMVERLLARRTELFLFESDFVRRRYLESAGKPPGQICVVRNGIHKAEFAPIAREEHPADLVYVGEFRAAKGLNVLVDALCSLRSRQGRAPSAVLIGSGAGEDDLRRRIQECDLGDTTTILAPRPIRQALSKADILVMPSLAESLPYVSLEAAAAGQPMVSTNVGGIPEIFGPFSQQLIAPGDAKALADAIASMIATPAAERSARAAMIADHVSQNFSITRMIDGVVAGYTSAAPRRSRADARSRAPMGAGLARQ
jgi:glycosyltransferase involved in cell wall biosynthesis